MSKKWIVILEIVVVFVVFILAIFLKFIPEYKKAQGSSDRLIDLDNYQGVVEVNIDNILNFMIVVDKANQVSQILFLDANSLCLYNKDIENKKIDSAIYEITTILVESGYIKANSNVVLTRYQNNFYSSIKKEFLDQFKKLQIAINLIEEESTLVEKAIKLQVEGEDEQSILRMIDLYSKEIIDDMEISSSDTNNLEEKDIKKFSDLVYNKLENYAKERSIENQSIDSAEIPISLIPADSVGKYYPTVDSWYYIKDYKIYAYIAFEGEEGIVSYCYEGSINQYKKGSC